MAATRGPELPSARPSAIRRSDIGVEPEGITRRVVLNLLEAFFRRPWLYVLPIVLFMALGAASGFSSEAQYRSIGTLTAGSGDLFSELTQSANPSGFGYESPAAVTSGNLNQFLRTDEFLQDVATRADLTEAIESGVYTLDDISSDTYSYDDGTNLVRVQAQTTDPEVSQRLASATIAAFIDWMIDRDVSESRTAESVLEEQVATAEQRMLVAQKALDTYLVQHPTTDEDTRPQAEQIQVQRLTAAADRAVEQYLAQEDRLEEARLTTAQTQTVVEQRLRVLDDPVVPTAPEPRLKSAVMTIAIFTALGTIIAVVMVVIAASLDRSLRVPGDVSAKFGLDVLAVVPDVAR